MPKPSALDRACEAVGNQAELARLLGITSQAISKWKSNGSDGIPGVCPAVWAPRIERATKRAVMRDELRPDLYR